MCQLQKTLLDKLDSFKTPLSDDKKVFKNMAKSDFETVCVQEDKFRDTDTTIKISKHVPISVSISSNLIERPIFFCNSNPATLVESFVDALGVLATESKVKLKSKNLEIENRVKSKLNQIFSAPNQCDCHKEPICNLRMSVSEKQKSKVCRHCF